MPALSMSLFIKHDPPGWTAKMTPSDVFLVYHCFSGDLNGYPYIIVGHMLNGIELFYRFESYSLPATDHFYRSNAHSCVWCSSCLEKYIISRDDYASINWGL